MMVAGQSRPNMPGLFRAGEVPDHRVASEMSVMPPTVPAEDGPVLHRLVLFLFIMLINVLLNVFIKKKKED